MLQSDKITALYCRLSQEDLQAGESGSIYFTHPYTSCEKGTVECHNRMLRRFIPKGQSIDDYSADEIMIFADIMNALPRKLLRRNWYGSHRKAGGG